MLNFILFFSDKLNMDRVMLYNFTKSEHLFYDAMLRKLAPRSEFKDVSSSESFKTGNYNSGIVNCSTNSWNAFEVINKFIEEKKKIIVFSSLKPNAYFLCLLKNYVEQKKKVFPLVCPESSSEIAYCAEAFFNDTSYLCPILERLKNKEDLIERQFCFSKLKDLDRSVIYGLLSGESAKVIALATGKSQHSIECRINTIKQKCRCLHDESSTVALLSFLNT